MSRPRDPGWRPAAVGVVAAVVPTLGARLARRSANALVLMRQLWVTFATVMLLVGVVAWILASVVDGGVDGRFVAGAVVAIGVVAQVVAPRFLPPLQGASPAVVRRSASRAFFLRVALAESVALLAFVGVLLSGNPAVYLVGLVVAGIGLVEAAPTARWIARGQAELRQEGSSVDLLGALIGGGVG